MNALIANIYARAICTVVAIFGACTLATNHIGGWWWLIVLAFLTAIRN